MNRIDRISAILIQLQSKRVVKAQEIADRFEISLRTVYRDIRSLEESGVPIVGEAGLGYSLVKGYNLPPVMFSQQEAIALVMGSKMLEHFTDDDTQNNFQSALMKVKAVLNIQNKDILEELEKSISVQKIRVPREKEFANKKMLAIQDALIKKQRMQIEYVSAYTDETNSRKIEPIGLLHYGNRWHLIAWCTLRKSYRDFRVDRIDSLVILPDHYQTHDKITLDEYLKAQFDSFNITPVKVRFKKKSYPYIEQTKYHYGFIKEELDGDEYILDFMTMELEYFARWMMSYTDRVTIVEPPELKDIAKRLSVEYYNLYN